MRVMQCSERLTNEATFLASLGADTANYCSVSRSLEKGCWRAPLSPSPEYFSSILS